MSTEIVKAERSHIPVTDLERMALHFVNSKLFGMQNVAQAVTLMMVAQAEGLHPATAARDYHIIQGKPSLRADAIVSRFQQAGGRIKWLDLSDRIAKAEFSHPAGGTVVIDWTMERAKAAGLSDRDMWRKYPRQMLRARVISEGVRTVYPGVVCGVYEESEVRDMMPDPAPAAEPEPQTEVIEQDATSEQIDAAFKAASFEPEEADAAIAAACKSKRVSGIDDMRPADRVAFVAAIAAGKFDKFKQKALVS